MRYFVTAAIAIFVLAVQSAGLAAGQNLIKNGGFDMGPQPGYFATFAKGSTAIPGWIVTFGTVDVIGPNWHDADRGRNAVDLDGTPGPGAIAQTLSTVKGGVYRLTFALAGNPECGPSLKRMQVTAGRTVQRYSFSTAHTSDSHMGWQMKSLTFAASGARTSVTFLSLDPAGTNCGAAIDAVSVVRVK